MVILNATPKYLAYYYQQWLWWCGDGGSVDVGGGGGSGGNDKKQWWQQHASRGIYKMKVFLCSSALNWIFSRYLSDNVAVTTLHIIHSKVRIYFSLRSVLKNVSDKSCDNCYVILNKNTDMMQHDADFITADFLYMFRASCIHYQEYKILPQQPPVQVVMVAGRSSLRHNMAKWGSTCNYDYLYRWLPCQYFVLLMMGALRP